MIFVYRLLVAAAFATASSAVNVAAMASGSQMALIIGVEDYEASNKLKTPVNDARAVAQMLMNLGCDVTIVTNPTNTRLRSVLSNFKDQIRMEDSAIIYYAGTGFNSDGRDFIVGTDFNTSVNKNADEIGIEVSAILGSITGSNQKLRLAVFDMCREDLATVIRGSLSVATSEPAKPLVVFSATSGGIAFDQNAGSDNSPFATLFLKYAMYKDLSVREIFVLVQDGVMKITGSKQKVDLTGLPPDREGRLSAAVHTTR